MEASYATVDGSVRTTQSTTVYGQLDTVEQVQTQFVCTR